jgi:hypothetical protein
VPTSISISARTRPGFARLRDLELVDAADANAFEVDRAAVLEPVDRLGEVDLVALAAAPQPHRAEDRDDDQQQPRADRDEDPAADPLGSRRHALLA